MTKIIAHRGAIGHSYVENTLEAFERAIELGCDMVEFDVRRTKDNVLVVFHDRVFNDLPIKLSNYDTLESEAAKSGFHLPELEEVLNICKGRIFMDIEVKEHGFEKKLLRELDKVVSVNEYSIKSFNDKVPYTIKQLRPEITVGLLLGKEKAGVKRRLNELFPLRRLKECKADFVSPQYRFLVPGYVKYLKKAGFPIYVWTINDKKNIIKALSKEVDGIITDRPDRALVIRSNYTKD